jgi:hypothetical protein
MRGKITKRAVDSLVPASSDQFLWDHDLKGFGLKVTPAGKKIYIFQYRRGGRNFPTQRVKIGPHGRLTPDEARKEATRLSGTIVAGNDPAAVRADERCAPDVHNLAIRFLSEHVATKTKPRTAVEYQRLLRKIIGPALGRRRVRDIRNQDVAKLHHDLRATPYDANRALAVLSKMFNLAEKWGDRPQGSNPCRHVEKYRERKRERLLSEIELSRLGDALASYDGSPFVVSRSEAPHSHGSPALRGTWTTFGSGLILNAARHACQIARRELRRCTYRLQHLKF